MLLVPTFVLVLVIRKHENLSITYSKVMLGLSLTSPICLGVLSIPAVNQGSWALGEIFMGRLFVSPVVVVGLVFSRLLAQFDRAKRWTLYALLIEVGTLVLMGALFLLMVVKRG